jgi:hypothetical protein
MIKTGTYSRAQGLSSHYIRVSIEQQGVTIFQKDYLMGGSIRRKSFFWRDEIWEDVESEEYKYLASYIERIIDPNRQKRIAETEAKKREEEKLKAEKEVNLRKKFFQD